MVMTQLICWLLDNSRTSQVAVNRKRHCVLLITFRLSRRRRDMHIGHARLLARLQA